MFSTFSVFPLNDKPNELTKLPFRIFVEPLKEDIPFFYKDSLNSLRCPDCHSYFHGFCQYNERSWICSICGKKHEFNLVNSQTFEEISSIPSFGFWEGGEEYETTHVIIIGDGYGLEPAKTIIQTLPSFSKIEIYIFTTQEVVRKMVTTANSFLSTTKENQKSVRVPIGRTFPIIQTLLNGRKDCVWARIFCGGGTLDARGQSRLTQLNRGPLRTDFYLDASVTNHHSFASVIPGVVRVYSSNPHSQVSENSEKSSKVSEIPEKNGEIEKKSREWMCEIAASDCARSFAFQCKTTLRMGKNFRGDPLDGNSTAAVIASGKRTLEFVIKPLASNPSPSQHNANSKETSNVLENEPKLFQTVQAVSHCYKWDPPTNKVKKYASVITNDFETSHDLTKILSSASPSIIFEAICRENLVLNFNFMSNSKIIPNHALIPIKPLEGLLKKRKMEDFDEFQAEFSALCEPSSWRFVLETFIESWKAKSKKSNASSNSNENDDVIAIIIKHFPKVEFGRKEGCGVDLILANAARKYVELCRPLVVEVCQLPFEDLEQRII